MPKEVKKQIIVTGIRPTGDLHIGNYLGAVKPLLQTIEKYPDAEIYIFVADLHGLTDNEAATVAKFRFEVVKDYLALGLDKYINTGRVHLFIQSQIGELVSYLSLFLSRYTTFNDLMRVPTLKEKLRANQTEGQANALLGYYPILMASDILIHNATIGPIGQDQLPHLEKTREFGAKFNAEFGEVFTLPQAHSVENLRILSLKGVGKMSKSHPEGALFLSDSEKLVKQKVSRAETATEGTISPNLESLLTIAKEFNVNTAEFLTDHMAGKQVAGLFKKELCERLADFVVNFQKKRATIADAEVMKIIIDGGRAARINATKTLDIVKNVMKFNYIK
ncbi:MAG: tryptophan--tRNA ligase [Candidatus Vogelbacteria bacterium]|nr:tryptophan--tRNA ligase [Candidatus Vogelbacteria bacterium]